MPLKKQQLSLVEIFSILERPFKLEEKNNFNNHSCTPLFSHYINHWLEKALKLPQSELSLKRLKDLKNTFANYASKNIEKRKTVCQKGKKLLNEAKTLTFLERDIRFVKGVGPKRASYLKNLEIIKVRDLLMHFPHRYEDRSQFTPISKVKSGDYVTLKGEIRAKDDIFTYRRKRITKAIIDDGTDRIICIWFNQSYIKKLLAVGKEIILSGKVTGFSEKQIVHPVFEFIEKNDPIHTGRIVPIYPLTNKIGMRYLRTLVDRVLKEPGNSFAEYLPKNLISPKEFLSFEEAVRNIHFPESMEQKEKARARFIYEEFLFLQIGLLLMRDTKKETKNMKFKSAGDLIERLEQILPFSLTGSQKKILNKIKEDMTSSQRMMRLLHGEVGSGKTVIALGAILLAKDSGYQSTIMAPTAILAEQHYLTLQKFCLPLGMEIELIISGQKENDRKEIFKKLKEGKIDVLIGTHALLEENVQFKDLGLAVIDEEHKFGVLQRAHFTPARQGLSGGEMFKQEPEILVMSATPIPRSLALALYGDMDISTLNELPPGRAQTSTFWIEEKDKDKVYSFLKEELDKGHQAFVVTPLIEESSKLEADAATEIFKSLRENVFPSYRLALLHGRMKKDEQQKIMEEFRNKKTDILVATSLVEVGIDVPSATVMIILNAERFGLAQLHQLRGRIGRGEHDSYCILISTPKTEEGKKRLSAMASTQDGFEIAQEDLEIRGPGEILGTKQHGFPEMKLGDILKDLKLLEQAREDAENLLKESPKLENNEMLKDILYSKFPYITKLFTNQKL